MSVHLASHPRDIGLPRESLEEHVPPDTVIADNATINSILNDDILREIFVTLASMSAEPFQKQLYSVCRRWHRLVMATPLLWTYVPVSWVHFEDIIGHFENSCPALIDVHFTSWLLDNQLERIWNAVTQHASRLRTLTVRAYTVYEIVNIFNQWREIETPNLKSISVFLKDSDGSWPRPIYPWPGIDTLRTLKIQGTETIWFPPAPNLTFLELSSIRSGKASLQSIFLNFPSLETLVIQNAPLSHRYANFSFHDRDQKDDKLVCVPLLRSLAIGTLVVRTRSNARILPFLSAPNLEYLEYSGPCYVLEGRRHPLTFFQETDNQHPCKLQINPVDGLNINIQDVTFFSTLPSAVDLELRKLPEDGEDVLLALLSLTNLGSLTLNLYPPRPFRPGMGLSTFLSIVHRRKPVFGCPTFLRTTENISPTVKLILGSHVTFLPPHGEPGFLHAPPDDSEEIIGPDSGIEVPEFDFNGIENLIDHVNGNFNLAQPENEDGH